MLELPRLPGHVVRRVQPMNARKDYVCPECGNRVAAGQGHVVAWPEAATDLRRHWHTACWRATARRGRL